MAPSTYVINTPLEKGVDHFIHLLKELTLNNYDANIGMTSDLSYHQNKTWKIVDGLPINDFSRAKMDATAAELVEERDTALDFLSQ